MEDIGMLIEKLQHTEEEKDRASQRLEYIIEKAVCEMLDILYGLYPTLSKSDLIIRSYSGNSFDITEGIVIYSKGIDEKIVLDREKKLIHYKAIKEDLLEEQVSPQTMLEEIGFEKVYNNIKDMVREKIKVNNEEILTYRNKTSKIQKYMSELHDESSSI